MPRRIPCTGAKATCQHCIRFRRSLGTFGAILGQVFIFSILPVVPFAVVFSQAVYGATGAWLMGIWWYLGFPMGFAAMTWVDESKVSNDGRDH